MLSQVQAALEQTIGTLDAEQRFLLSAWYLDQRILLDISRFIGVLAEHERVACLAHLAECAHCREVLFLARKAAQIEEPAALPEAPVSFWQRLLRPAVVASVVAAAMVVVFSVGLYRMIRSAGPRPQVTASTKTPAETPPAASMPAASAPAAKVQRANARVAANTEEVESAA